MTYTVKEVSEMTGIPISTLRYYDKRGLFPFLKRNNLNTRIFSETDIATLQIIECLKNAGMKLEDIKKFSDWAMQGDSTLQQRLEMFYEQEKIVENQIAELKKSLEIICYKINYYEKAVEFGTEKNLFDKNKMPHFAEFCHL